MKKIYWYYETDGQEFCGFWKTENEYKTMTQAEKDANYGSSGPFNSFKEAKQDAIERYTYDRDTAKEFLRAIRLTKKKWITGAGSK